MAPATGTCIHNGATPALRRARNGLRWRDLIGRFLPSPARTAGVIDEEMLSEHRRRDIGLADGRGPSLRRPER
ncbi:hypothetical protein QNA08_13740 [Chelatococcus sp. SYSU_G07232]|uniref:DUF1127 domain-containing protein n=1 Tax=Chelatococcus albus TaxID=3047466 RepID=A0ABT7AIU4_9HYPH|nr:hypothetical protein [Chelatococcus sp. SYSU_G07232]MDJ1159297.1 hypothetical protein [Chelatococcus sp. SYSU_G07232]